MEENFNGIDVLDELDELEEGVADKTETTKEETTDCLQEYTVSSFSAVEQTSETFNAITESAARKIAHEVVTDAKDVKTGMKDAMAVRSTFNVAQDEGFQSQLDDIKKGEIKSEFQADAMQATVREMDAKRARNEAFYKAFRPILEFDFSNITGKEKKNPKTYDDRSYGLILMLVMIGIMLVPFVITTLFLAALTIVNMVFEYVDTFSEPAMKFCCRAAIAILVVVTVFVILNWVETRFGIPILHDPTVALLQQMLL